MITVRLMGGLGNQMFQYAAARSLGWRIGEGLRIDVGSFRDEDRTFGLDCFALSPDDVIFNRHDNAGFAERIYRKLRKTLSGSDGVFRDSDFFRYEPRFQQIGPGTIMEGYFQSERYFSDHVDDIRKCFTFRRPPDPIVEPLIDFARNSPSVAVHVRRGDYVTNPEVSAYLGVCPISYYLEALELMRKRLGEIQVLLFSDDLEWVRESFPMTSEMHLVTETADLADHEDMRIMSNCKHHIIANSSFSWWGAWLNTDRSKTVIAPKIWLRDTEQDGWDLIPHGWIRI